MLPTDQRIFYFADFHLSAKSLALFRSQKIVALEPQACRVLLYLVENQDRLVTKEELLENVWRDVFTTDDVLKKAVSQIRRALADDAENPSFVQTLHRRGYRFIHSVQENITDGAGAPANLPTAAPLPAPLKSQNSFEIQLSANDGDPDFDQLVGRAVEMELLQTEFRRVLRGRGQPILIAGDPGAGKTQLAGRFERWATTQQNAVCLRARFFDYEAARVSSSDLFLDLLREALTKLSPENTQKPLDLRLALETQTGVVLPNELFASGVAEANRLNAQSDAFRIVAPLAECFVRLSEKQPLVLVFDDLQWADEISLKIIGYLMRTAARAPLMIVALARRAEVNSPNHQISVWLQTQAVYRSYTTLNLAPLTTADYRLLITEIFNQKLDASEIAAYDLRELYRTTGGNPYFLVETLRMLIVENAVEKITTTDNGNQKFLWRWRGLGDVPLPETIRMAARSKLARLNSKTLDYIERAAVLGDAFHLETLEQMYHGDGALEADLETCLSEAVAAQVLTEQGVSGTDDCQFYHTTLRRAVYSDLSPRRRKRLHARAAAALEQIYRENPERVTAALAAHYEAAGNARLSFERSLQASETASIHFAWTEAFESIARARRAAELLDADSSVKISENDQLRLLLASGEASMSIGKRLEALADLTLAARLAEKLDDRVALAAALGIKAQTEVLLGRYRESLTASREALKLSREIESSRGVANALLQIASAQTALAEYEAACQVLQAVVDEFGAANYYAAVAVGKLGWVRALQSRYREARELLESALAFHREAGDVRQRVVLALCLDWAEYGAGNYQAAIGFAETARDEARNIGEPYSAAIAEMRIAKSRIAQGLFEEGENILKAVLSKLAGKNAVHSEAETIWFLGRAIALRGNLNEAAELFERAHKMICEIGDREDEFRVLIDIAHLQTEQNNSSTALRTATLAQQIAEDLKIPDGVGAALLELSRAHLALNQFSAALQSAKRAIELLETAGSGERWRAHYIYARVLTALPPNTTSEQSNLDTAENALRRTLELLSETRDQFNAADTDRRANFIRAHQEPARALYDVLIANNSSAKAAAISREWQLETERTNNQ